MGVVYAKNAKVFCYWLVDPVIVDLVEVEFSEWLALNLITSSHSHCFMRLMIHSRKRDSEQTKSCAVSVKTKVSGLVAWDASQSRRSPTEGDLGRK